MHNLYATYLLHGSLAEKAVFILMGYTSYFYNNDIHDVTLNRLTTKNICTAHSPKLNRALNNHNTRGA